MTLTTSTDEDEIADLRDFYYNKENSGLVIKTVDNEFQRFPYVYPYVCPFIRTSIRKNPMEFSIAIWMINYLHWLKNNCKYPATECLNMIKALMKTMPVMQNML